MAPKAHRHSARGWRVAATLAVLLLLVGNRLPLTLRAEPPPEADGPRLTRLLEADLARVALNSRVQRRVARLAWVLSTHPDARLRHGPWAAQLAETLCRTAANEADNLRVLAAAYAECGRMAEARRANLQTLQRALATGNQRALANCRGDGPILTAELALRDPTLRSVDALETPCDRLQPRALALALVVVGEEYLADGAARDARRCFEIARQADPSCRAACLALGRLYAIGSDLDQAAAHFETALSLRGDDPQCLVELAMVRMRQDRAEEALGLYLQAHQLRPDWLEVVNELAWHCATHPRLRPTNAAAALKAAQALCQASRPPRHYFLDTLAAAYAANGRFDQAAQTMEQAIAALEAASPGSRRAERLGDYRLRQQLYRIGQPYENAAQAAIYVSRSYADRGDWDTAAALLQRAHSAHPDDANLLVTLASARSRQGQPAEAIGLYIQALRLEPHRPEVANELVWLLATHDAAACSAEDMVALAQEVCRLTRMAVPRYLDTLAAAYARAGRFTEAQQAQDRAIALLEETPPREPHVRQARIELYRARRRLYAAGRDLRQEAQSHLELALEARRNRQWDHAAEHFQAVLAQRGPEPLVLAMLAGVRAAQGRRDEAQRLYHQARRLWPDCPAPNFDAAIR